MKNLKLLIIALFTSVSVFANDSEKLVKETFSHDYESATNVVWVKSGDLYLVNFDVEDIKTKAVYNKEGQLVKLIQYVIIDQIPLSLRTRISNILGNKKLIQNLTILSNSEETYYYVRAEDDKHFYTYKIAMDGYYERVEKFKKA